MIFARFANLKLKQRNSQQKSAKNAKKDTQLWWGEAPERPKGLSREIDVPPLQGELGQRSCRAVTTARPRLGASVLPNTRNIDDVPNIPAYAVQSLGSLAPILGFVALFAFFCGYSSSSLFVLFAATLSSS